MALVTGTGAPAIIDRATWDAAQAAGAGHGSSRDGDDPNPHPATRRTYLLRSRVRCKLCQRRMCGITRTHRDRGPHGDYTYYICQFDPGNPRHAAAVPGHPRTVAARQDLLLATLRDGLARYALTPGRAERLAELLPAGAADAQARHDAQAAALRLRLKQADAAEHNLITELNNAAGMPAKAADAYRARIRQQFVTLYGERETLTGQLDALDKDTGRHGTDPALLDELPELAGAGRAARTDPGRAVRRVRHPDPVERAHETGNVFRHHHRHHPRHRDRPPRPSRRRRPRHRQHRHGPGPGPSQHRHVFGSIT